MGVDETKLKGAIQFAIEHETTLPKNQEIAQIYNFYKEPLSDGIGAFAERMKFGAMCAFSVAWFTFVYLPACHMVWGGGVLATLGAKDFAGGTVVHINAGIAALGQLVGAWNRSWVDIVGLSIAAPEMQRPRCDIRYNSALAQALK